MDMVFILIGIIVLLITYYDFSKSKTSPIVLFAWSEWLEWISDCFSISRHSSPILFWLCIIGQTGFGVSLIYGGLMAV